MQTIHNSVLVHIQWTKLCFLLISAQFSDRLFSLRNINVEGNM
jgi:hypothetical protein